MDLINLIAAWEQRARRNFWDAEQMEDPVEKNCMKAGRIITSDVLENSGHA